MQTIGTYAAKTGFTALLKRAARGERIAIAKHGVPVAILQAFAETPQAPVRETIQAIKEFRRSRSLGSVSLRALKRSGRR